MAKISRHYRLSNETLSQLEDLQDWLRVEDQTKTLEQIIEEAHMSGQEQIDKWLKDNYPIGAPITVDLDEPVQGIVNNYTTDNMHSQYANGVMIKFEDGSFLDVPYSRLA